MRKIVWAVVVAGVFLAGAMVTAQETSSKPASPRRMMGRMMGMMGEESPMKSMDHGAMMERMQGMEQMMEQCRQMMAGAHATEPSGDR